jgi:hypothetical protein
VQGIQKITRSKGNPQNGTLRESFKGSSFRNEAKYGSIEIASNPEVSAGGRIDHIAGAKYQLA